jgi:hypothetical protein
MIDKFLGISGQEVVLSGQGHDFHASIYHHLFHICDIAVRHQAVVRAVEDDHRDGNPVQLFTRRLEFALKGEGCL